MVIWFDGIQFPSPTTSPPLRNRHLQGPGPLSRLTSLLPLSKPVAPQKAGPSLTSAETSTGHSCPWRHRHPLHFTGGRAGRQTAVCSQEGTLVWGASCPCVDSWLDGFGPFSGKGKGQVLSAAVSVVNREHVGKVWVRRAVPQPEVALSEQKEQGQMGPLDPPRGQRTWSDLGTACDVCLKRQHVLRRPQEGAALLGQLASPCSPWAGGGVRPAPLRV